MWNNIAPQHPLVITDSELFQRSYFIHVASSAGATEVYPNCTLNYSLSYVMVMNIRATTTTTTI